MVRDADLRSAQPGFVHTDEELGGEEDAIGVDAVERHGIEDLPPEELEGAIDVAHAQAEERCDESVVAPSDEASTDRVAPLPAIRDDGIRSLQLGEEHHQIGRVELPITIREEDERLGSRADPRPHRPAITMRALVVHGANGVETSGQRVGDLAGAVAGPVIHDDDLEVFRKGGQRATGAFDERFDVRLLVQRGEEIGKTFQSMPLGHVALIGAPRFSPSAPYVEITGNEEDPDRRALDEDRASPVSAA